MILNTNNNKYYIGENDFFILSLRRKKCFLKKDLNKEKRLGSTTILWTFKEFTQEQTTFFVFHFYELVHKEKKLKTWSELFCKKEKKVKKYALFSKSKHRKILKILLKEKMFQATLYWHPSPPLWDRGPVQVAMQLGRAIQFLLSMIQLYSKKSKFCIFKKEFFFAKEVLFEDPKTCFEAMKTRFWRYKNQFCSEIKFFFCWIHFLFLLCFLTFYEKNLFH